MRVREQLRAATAEIHAALHGARPFARIAEGGMDRPGHAALLRLLLRYHAAMTPLCAAGAARLGAPELAAAQRCRLEALRADLRALGGTAPAIPALAPRDGDFAVGVLYTVLGSTLGGKVIHRQLDALLPGEEGRRFFKGHADDGVQWRLFCERLEAAGLDMAQAQAGAAYAFACLRDMLEEESPALVR
jgi:heme oxygenase